MKERLLSLIKTDFPAIEINQTELASNGWDHDVVIVNDEIVFRFPRDGETFLDIEVAVLDRLCGKTTLAIPKIEFRGQSALYVGYRKVRGSELTPEVYARLTPNQQAAVARDLATFLHEVHRELSVPTARQLGVRVDNPHEPLTESLPLLTRLDDREIIGFLEATFAELEEMLATPGPESFLYNDLHGDNMGFDVAAGRLNGIFDFGDIAIGDLHREFGPLYRLDKRLLEATVRDFSAMTGISLSLRRIVMIQRLDRISDLAMVIVEPDHPEPPRVFAELREW
ncbi:MAG TPA: phosphotransferase, partial [Gemmatimonadaceae bacterium]